jgi:hypothetical protein
LFIVYVTLPQGKGPIAVGNKYIIIYKSFMKIGSGIQELIRGIHKEAGIALVSFYVFS